uniref:Putative secreted protein n=1 Tax=Anopheles darlingi TaxID=43151 RepID=A0A2M4D5S7_ANODA
MVRGIRGTIKLGFRTLFLQPALSFNLLSPWLLDDLFCTTARPRFRTRRLQMLLLKGTTPLTDTRVSISKQAVQSNHFVTLLSRPSANGKTVTPRGLNVGPAKLINHC